MLVSELGLETATEVVSVLDWEHLSLGHLRLSPTVIILVEVLMNHRRSFHNHGEGLRFHI